MNTTKFKVGNKVDFEGGSGVVDTIILPDKVYIVQVNKNFEEVTMKMFTEKELSPHICPEVDYENEFCNYQCSTRTVRANSDICKQCLWDKINNLVD